MTTLATAGGWSGAQWAGVVVLLLFIGIVLLAIEIVVIPGFGFVGVSGIAAVLVAAMIAGSRLGAAWGAVTLVAGAAASGLALWWLPRTRAGRTMILTESQKDARAAAPLAHLHGARGVALTPLRPAGAAEIDGQRIDVVTDGVYVDSGAPVRVVLVEGSRVVVEPLAS